MPLNADFAAIDLGSNSFHMIVVRVENDQIHVIDRLREMVRLGGGLDEKRNLKAEVETRALACLEQFGQRLKSIPSQNIRAVGTNTFRRIRKPEPFLKRASEALGHPIEIIAGREEARLVYLGVAHGLPTSAAPRLVVDIGGGSTECIIGRGFEPMQRESLEMGCVSMTQRAFADGVIDEATMEGAVLRARMEVMPVRHDFTRDHWFEAVGSSGTIRAIRTVVQEQGWCDSGITAGALKKLRRALARAGAIDAIDLKGLSNERKPVFAGGVAVLSGVFEELRIEEMRVSDQALREGLIYDMLGRFDDEDVRGRSVMALSRRFAVNEAHAVRVERTAVALLAQVLDDWNLDATECTELLSWAVSLHEIGLAIAHAQFHKHGFYLLTHADMPGFSRQQQYVLATLVRGHRRKFPDKLFKEIPADRRASARRLCVLLRLSVLLNRMRSSANLPLARVSVKSDTLRLRFPEGWLESNPLIRAELERENGYLAPAGFALSFA